MTDLTLDWLNAASVEDFTTALGEMFENASWVARAAAAARPLATVAALHAAMMDAMRAAPADRVLAFLRGHPELGGAAAAAGTMGADSTAEQAALGLQRADGSGLPAMNAEYAARFGFPFIVCVRRHTLASLLAVFQRRLAGDRAAEHAAALQEIGYITRLRLCGRVSGPGVPMVHGSLSTHVLDAAVGRPAAGVAIELFEAGGETARLLGQFVTNTNGRTDGPLLSGAPLRMGIYELRFHMGAYFGSAADAFLGVVPVRFGIGEAEAHYHIPLLASPGAYSTYRGS